MNSIPGNDGAKPAPLVVILGPTASGKTDLAIALAQRFDGEIVGADSRQVFREMEIGTAKPTPAQRAAIPHHLIDVCAPNENYNVALYQRAATATIATIHQRGKLPFLAGGTGLYLRAVARGYSVPAVAPQPELRRDLEALLSAQGVAALYERLSTLDPVAARRVDPSNPRRIIRAIEIALSQQLSVPDLSPSEAPLSAQEPYRVLWIGLNGTRELLYQRADQRVDAMLQAGFLEEVRHLLAAGYPVDSPALSGVGYAELAAHLSGQLSLIEAHQRIKYATHALIRRQLTWFRKEPDVEWYDIATPDLLVSLIDRLGIWLDPMAMSRTSNTLSPAQIQEKTEPLAKLGTKEL